MSITAAGPVPLSRVWSGRKILAEDLGGEDLGDVLDLHAGASAWWVLDRTTEHARDDLRRLGQALDLDPLVLFDLAAEDGRVKFEEVGAVRLVLTCSVAVDQQQATLRTSPLSLVVTDRALICLADPAAELAPARVLAGQSDRLSHGDVDLALLVLLHGVVDAYAEVVDWLESASDQLSDVLFEERPLTRTEQLHAFRLRRVLSDLRRVTEPMRSVFNDLAAAAADDDPALARKWTLLREKHDRTADAADGLRDALAAVFETSLALADVQLNTIMKKLTGWAAVIAVPTLVTSFVGMNVAFPLSGTVAGFWVSIVIMIASGLALWLVLRRQNWI